MDSLKGGPAYTRHLRPLWLRLVVLFIILGLAIAGSMPAAAAPQRAATWPRCNWACAANDVQVTGAWLGSSAADPDAELPASCSPGGTETAYLWVEIYNQTSANRYAYGVIADVDVEGTPLVPNEWNCVDGTIAGGETKTVMLYGPFSWPCGAHMMLRNVVVFWDTNSGAICTTNCPGHPMGQSECFDAFEVEIPCDIDVEVTPAEYTLDCEHPEVELEATVTGATSYTITWYLDGVQVGTGGTYTANTAGVYRAEVSADSCTASDTALVTYDERMPAVEVTTESAQLPCPTGEVTLTAHVDLKGYQGGELQWYGDGDEIEGATDEELVVSEGGHYQVRLTVEECEVWSNVVHVLECEEEEEVCIRADVSAIIWGGWDGIPVRAWVDGTAQETLFTARDASGQAAVLWTFYPPADETWHVVVTPQLPAGLDPERWKYEPASRSVSIERCSEEQLSFQLRDTGPKVEVILPVTGGAPGWWQGLLHWLAGLFAR